MEGTVFTFYADADVYNASRKVGKSWDDEWKQPAAVEWSAELKVNGTSVSVNDYFEKVEEEANVATPMIKYRLKKDMPSGLEFTVKAVSLHRKGENKNHAAYYDTAGQDKDIYGTDTVEPRDTKISGTGYMVLEPTQSGSVKPVISMLGAATDNLKCELVGATDSATTVTYVDGQVTVKLGADETGSTQYYVNEKGNSVNGSGIIKAVIYSGDKVYDDLEDKADTAKVYIFVRRVTGLDLNYKIMSGTNYPHTEPFKEDTTYQFRTRIDGTNLETLWFETGYKEKASTTDKTKIANSELNVIGLTTYEAIPLVDKFLDDCFLAKLQTARIVHGKGTGKLRTEIQKFLKKHPKVKSYRSGTYGEGEMGVTIVNLKI